MPNMRWHLTLSAPRTRRNLVAELVFQTGVDAFGHGAEIVDQAVEVGHVDELQALDFAAPFGLGLVVGAKVAVDDGGVATAPGCGRGSRRRRRRRPVELRRRGGA